MRNKYRSAVYVFNEKEKELSTQILRELQTGFEEKLITQVLSFNTFKASDEMFHNYYYSNKEKPFCKSYISPKLKLLLAKFSEQVNREKVK